MSSNIASANKSYYSSRGKKIYSDFSTFAQGKALATCNAIEFVRDFSSHPAPVVVCEYGVGKGDFAKTFLDEVKRRSARLYSKTRYYLFDFSEKMLKDARANLRAHRGICVFGRFDAAREEPDLKFDYCRINELLTDLPARFYAKKGGRILELVPDAKGKFLENAAPFPSPLATAFLSRTDEGRAIPFNFDAEKFLLSLCQRGNGGFRIDLFDYGFYDSEEVFLLPVEEWNRLMVRDYGGQKTVDLNFPQMLSALSSGSIKAEIEKQKEYAERVLGKKLEMRQAKSGLDYVPSRPGDAFAEDDGFYHLRAGR